MTVSKQTNAELIDYKFKIMNDELKAHRIETKEDMKALHSKIDSSTLALHAKMDAFIESANGKFATKQEVEEIKDTNKKIFWVVIGGIGSIITGVITYVLKKVGISL